MSQLDQTIPSRRDQTSVLTFDCLKLSAIQVHHSRQEGSPMRKVNMDASRRTLTEVEEAWMA